MTVKEIIDKPLGEVVLTKEFGLKEVMLNDKPESHRVMCAWLKGKEHKGIYIESKRVGDVTLLIGYEWAVYGLIDQYNTVVYFSQWFNANNNMAKHILECQIADNCDVKINLRPQLRDFREKRDTFKTGTVFFNKKPGIE